MALGITNAFVQLFDAEVHQAYQGARALAGLDVPLPLVLTRALGGPQTPRVPATSGRGWQSRSNPAARRVVVGGRP